MPTVPTYSAVVIDCERQIVQANDHDRRNGIADEEDTVLLLVGTAQRATGSVFNFELKFRTDADLDQYFLNP